MKIVRVTRIDEEKQDHGVWVEYGPVELCIARFPSDEASRKLNQLRKTNRNRELDVTGKKARDAILNLIAERVLLNWKGVKGEENGNLVDLPYTEDNCKQLLKVDPDLLDFVSDFSRDIDNFMVEDEDTTVGES